MMKATRELLSELRVDCFTIDEAHCISEWGHDFRPDYRLLADVRKDYPEAVCLALTATATPRVRDDIQNILEMKDSSVFVASFNRDNLLLNVADKVNPLDQILDFLYTRPKQSGIIYCFSRRQVNELYGELKKRGTRCCHTMPDSPRHSGLIIRKRSLKIMCRSSLRLSPLGWVSTSPTYGSCCTTTCLRILNPIISRSAVREETVYRPTVSCSTAIQINRRSSISSIRKRVRRRRSLRNICSI